MQQHTVDNMSTPVASSSPSSAVETSIPSKQRSPGHSQRKTRVVRRRGRAKGDLESEDEIVREVGTDSESEDDLSTMDSDTEPASEGAIADGRSRPLTPSTSDSPQSQNKDIPTRIDADPQPFFSQPSTWEEMVAEENAHGPAELPVIDFADFNGEAVPNGHVPHPLPSKSKTPLEGSRDRSPRSETKVNARDEADHTQPTSRRSRSSTSRRLTGQSARQAYQQRLESDPSFVPTVGGFWGHDERLLGKDLRSLSGWWRGRWQNRGRGRGVTMRSRGSHSQRSSHESEDNGDALDLPAIERTWTHDGFEEMKRKEEQRRAALQQQPQANQTRGGHVDGGGFASTRGGRGSSTRGGPPSTSPRSSTAHAQGRVWYTMKPELMWTRQHEAFLFFDSSTKPRNRPSFRVKLPGSDGYVMQSKFQARQHDVERQWRKPEPRATDSGDNAYTVRIPKTTGKEKAIEPLTTVEEASLEDIFTVRPNLVTPIPIPIPESDNKLSTATTDSSKPSSTDGKKENGPQSEQALISQLEMLTVLPQESDQARLAKTEEAVLKKSSPEQSSSTTDQRPVLPPLQTVFTPPPAHPSPAYGAAYPYGPTLPPGVALNAHGMPYELATGRHVFLAPPVPLYTPRPLMPHMTPGAVYIPNHMSPDFLSQSSSHTPPMNGFVDLATGTPLFSLPRQTRIEIRAPTDEYDGKGSRKGQSHQSNTTTKAPTVSSPPQPSSQPSYPTLTRPTAAVGSPPHTDSEARDSQASGDFSNQRTDSHLVPYPSYYYYPESFGYYPYMDMSQAGQYDAYSSDPRSAQGTVYY